MAISLSSIVSKSPMQPPRILIYGVHGVGKTSWATSAPSPIVIQTEDGLGVIEAPHFPLAKTWQDVIEAFGVLIEDKHDFATVVIDSLDWLEPLIWTETCVRNGWNTLEDAGFGKGYIATADLWREYLQCINTLRNERGCAIIQIAHCDIKRFDDPERASYDRYLIKLHARASALVQEHSDCVFFANYRTHVIKEKAGFGQEITKATGGGERVIYTEERPAFLAKNRYNLPEVMPLNWAAFEAALPKPPATTATKGK